MGYGHETCTVHTSWTGVHRALPTGVGDVTVSATMTFNDVHISSYGWAKVMKLGQRTQNLF